MKAKYGENWLGKRMLIDLKGVAVPFINFNFVYVRRKESFKGTTVYEFSDVDDNLIGKFVPKPITKSGPYIQFGQNVNQPIVVGLSRSASRRLEQKIRVQL